MKTVKVDNLAAAIMEDLQNLNTNTEKSVKQAVEEVAKETKNVIDDHITFNEITGDYKKSMAIKKTYESESSVTYKWYVKKPHYRLTHLLENGHATRKADKRAQAFPHIIYGDEYAREQLPKRIKEAIENAK